MAQKEASARIKINNLLTNSGWRFFDDQNGDANIALEPNVKITQKDIDGQGEDFENISNGFVDFLLLDDRGFPLVVLEAKREDKNPLDGKEQARRYAQTLNVRFVILSNGNVHYFWDLERSNPNLITVFPTPESLKHIEAYKPNPQKLTEEQVDFDYVALTQQPEYKLDPRYIDEKNREDYIRTADLKFLRPYQLKAIHALQAAAKEGKDRFLFEMATGTGKTLISAGVIKLFLKSGNAKRVLFLVDRIELEEQAQKAFVKYLKNDFTSVIYKENRGDWKKAEIVVSTVQSLSFNSKYKKLFSPTDFDLIISDEAHRSIGGNSRAVFEYFVGYKLGLTATPKDYLKRIDAMELGQRDPRAWERRQLMDTYTTFGCDSGEPTYRYTLLNGVKDGFLINPVVSDARTEITTELLSEEGYSMMLENEEGVEEEQVFFHSDFERKFFSEKTNQIFCKTFIENALKDPITGEIGKSIVFCVSQSHASKVTQILNEFAHQLWPGKYNSDFAVQVTSNIAQSQDFTINFANNNLNGQSAWVSGYKTSKTRVCVTVGMMTTGYDCQDVLNLCLMRPIFSPTDFIQIKGRGTRKHTFVHINKENGDEEVIKINKEKFKMFDFFANCEYFEEKYNYDEILKLPSIKSGTSGPIGEPNPSPEEVNIYNPDPLKTLKETEVGVDGMKIDRKLFEKFEEDIKSDPNIRTQYENGDYEAIENYIKENIFEKPQEFYNLDKLRKAVKADRRISLREIVEKVFGGIDKFKSKDELLEEEFEKFVSIYKPESSYYYPIKHYLKAYITDSEIRDIIESKDYARLATNPKLTLSELRALNVYRDIVPEYVKDYVSLNKYM